MPDMPLELVVVCMLDVLVGPVIAIIMFGDPRMTTEWVLASTTRRRPHAVRR